MNRIQDIINQLNDKERMEKIHKQEQENKEKIENRIRKEREEQQIKEERRLKRKIARIKYLRRRNGDKD